MIWAILLAPILGAIVAVAVKENRHRRIALLCAAIVHFAFTSLSWVLPFEDALRGWIAIDNLGKIFLTLTSALFLAASFYTIGYLRRESGHATKDYAEGFVFTNNPEALFISCMLVFLSTMSLVAVSEHFGLLWVAVEATTLFSAPLVYFHRHHRSLEATWKYLLICSVGIALALLGNYFVAFAAKGRAQNIGFELLIANAASFNPIWMKTAFIFFIVGYGTKMGLAPMHNWLPDAHSEAPSMISALLSGSVLNCAFLAILRMHIVMNAAGLGKFSGDLLVMFGLISMAVAAIFIIRQTDFKRMLAYSSVEHMGILAFGVGLGGVAYSGSLLHMVNHSLTKAMLFFAAGNILAAYKTKNISDIRGIMKFSPVTGFIWVAGFLAIAGSPPFGIFVSETIILKSAIDAGRWYAATGYLLALGAVFAAMSKIVFDMTFGYKNGGENTIPAVENAESKFAVVPPLALGALTLFLGFYVPKTLWELIASSWLAGGY